MKLLRSVGTLLALLQLAACAGSSSPATTGGPDVLAPGSYTLSLALLAPSSLQAPVSGISMSLQLPPGVTVAAVAPGSDRIAPEAFSAGSALTGPSLLSGRFATGSREATLAVATVPPGGWSGEFGRLRVVVQPGAVVTASDLESAPVKSLKSVGVDGVARATVELGQTTSVAIRLDAR